MVDRTTTLFEYAQDVIDERVAEHWEIAEDLIAALVEEKPGFGGAVKIAVNPRRIYLAVESAYQDIARYKNFHQNDPWNEKLDCTKRCAFLLKWISKFKPIQRMDDGGAMNDISDPYVDEIELINELFALHLFALHLSDEISLDIQLSKDKMKQLSYDLLYRNISKDGWMAILQLIKDCCHPTFVDNVSFVEKL